MISERLIFGEGQLKYISLFERENLILFYVKKEK